MVTRWLPSSTTVFVSQARRKKGREKRHVSAKSAHIYEESSESLWSYHPSRLVVTSYWQETSYMITSGCKRAREGSALSRPYLPDLVAVPLAKIRGLKVERGAASASFILLLGNSFRETSKGLLRAMHLVSKDV